MNKLFVIFIVLAVSGCPKDSEQSSTPISDKAEEITNKTAEDEPPIQEVVVEQEGVSREEGALWEPYAEMDLPDLERRIEPTTFTLWQADYEALLMEARNPETRVPIPMGNQIIFFQVEDSGTMPEAMREKYPNIISLKGISPDGEIKARIDFNDLGLLVEFDAGTKTYLSPLLKGSKRFYAYYAEEAIKSKPRDKSFE